MKQDVWRLLTLAALSGTLLVACETQHPVVVTPTGRIVVPQAPPSTREETPGKPPAAADVWVPGYWTYSNSRWVWVPGQWQAPPRVGSTWVAGHWDHTSEGWVWTPGHWE